MKNIPDNDIIASVCWKTSPEKTELKKLLAKARVSLRGCVRMCISFVYLSVFTCLNASTLPGRRLLYFTVHGFRSAFTVHFGSGSSTSVLFFFTRFISTNNSAFFNIPWVILFSEKDPSIQLFSWCKDSHFLQFFGAWEVFKKGYHS